MIWGVLSIMMLVLVMGVAVFIYRQDRRYLKQRTRDVLGKELRQEIEDEIIEAKDRQKKFKSALEKAAKLSESQDNSLTKV